MIWHMLILSLIQILAAVLAEEVCDVSGTCQVSVICMLIAIGVSFVTPQEHVETRTM